MLPHEIISKDDILGEGGQPGRGLWIPGPEPGVGVVGKAAFQTKRGVPGLAGLVGGSEGPLPPLPWGPRLPGSPLE